jgi:hypothetical protein
VKNVLFIKRKRRKNNMWGLIITIFIIVLGSIFTLTDDGDWRDTVGSALDWLGVIFLIVEIILLCIKPIDYKHFKIKYETIKEMTTSASDVRDATYTEKLIEINEEIKKNREFINNDFIGIFYNKEIANMELLGKK